MIAKLAKTVRIGARAIAHFAQAVRPEIRPLPDAESRQLAVLFAHRNRPAGMRTAQVKRRQQTTFRMVATDITAC